MDSILKDRPKSVNFIKCDVEGFEIEVIKGALNIIHEDKPLIVLEAEMPDTKTPTDRSLELVAYMKSLDYLAYNFDLINNNLKIERLGSFTVNHANILFKHKTQI